MLKLTELTKNIYVKMEKLERELETAKKSKDLKKAAKYYREKIFLEIEDMRPFIDELEKTVSKKYWLLPTYADMLYSIS